MTDSKRPAKTAATTEKKYDGFTEEERGAMKERAKELKSAGKKADEEQAVVEKIAEMSQPDRGLAEQLHAIIKDNAPALSPKLYYGMPAYAKDGKVVCFFQPSAKFNTRYSTFGFNDTANIDDGTMFPTAFGLTKLTPADKAKLTALIKKAVS